jgi:hypothetical protein
MSHYVLEISLAEEATWQRFNIRLDRRSLDELCRRIDRNATAPWSFRMTGGCLDEASWVGIVYAFFFQEPADAMIPRGFDPDRQFAA